MFVLVNASAEGLEDISGATFKHKWIVGFRTAAVTCAIWPVIGIWRALKVDSFVWKVKKDIFDIK